MPNTKNLQSDLDYTRYQKQSITKTVAVLRRLGAATTNTSVLRRYFATTTSGSGGRDIVWTIGVASPRMRIDSSRRVRVDFVLRSKKSHLRGEIRSVGDDGTMARWLVGDVDARAQAVGKDGVRAGCDRFRTEMMTAQPSLRGARSNAISFFSVD